MASIIFSNGSATRGLGRAARTAPNQNAFRQTIAIVIEPRVDVNLY